MKQHLEDQKIIKEFTDTQKVLSERLQDFEMKMSGIQNEKSMLE